jgi:hypothetical protein
MSVEQEFLYLCFIKVFQDVKDKTGMKLFESGKRTQDKQETHTVDAAKLVEHSLKQTLLGLAHHLFGKGQFVTNGLRLVKLVNRSLAD